MPRLILAVITGYLVFAISTALLFQLSGQDPHVTPTLLFGIVSILYGIVCAAMAGFVAARFAPRSNLAASVAVGVLIAAGAVVSIITQGTHSQIWSQLSALLLMAPAAYLGGVLFGKNRGMPR